MASNHAADDKRDKLLPAQHTTIDMHDTQQSIDVTEHCRSDGIVQHFARCFICYFAMALIPSAAALALAMQDLNAGESSPCRFAADAEAYAIDLDVWLLVASICALLTAVLYIFACTYLVCCASIPSYTKLTNFVFRSTTHLSLQWLLSLFHAVWAVLGLHIYAQQMSMECQHSSIGAMVLIFCILQLLSLCCSCCATCALRMHTTATYARHWGFRARRNDAFRCTQQEIEAEACPEMADQAYLSAHPYIKVQPFRTPSFEYRALDDFLHTGKMKQIREFEANPVAPPPKSAVAKQRIGAGFWSMALVKPPCSKRNLVVDNIYIKDVRVAVIAASNASMERGLILYTHGGAYMVGSHRDALPMLAVLSQQTGCVAISIDYKLAPEYPLPRCVEDALTVYQWVCDIGNVRSNRVFSVTSNCPAFLRDANGEQMHERVVVSGDSAGGGLCLLTLQAIERRGWKMACCGWPISPWTKLTGFESQRNYYRDAMLAPLHNDVLVALLVGNMSVQSGESKSKHDATYCDPEHATFSPLNAQCTGLCPLYISVGATEVLLDDALKFAEKAYSEGVQVELELEPYLCHVYPTLVSVFPEATQAVHRAAKFINRQLDVHVMEQ